MVILMFRIIREFENQTGHIIYAGYDRVCPRGRYILQFIYGKNKLVGKVIHHIDENKKNDNPENLLICTFKEHKRLHKLLNMERESLYNTYVKQLWEKYMK